MNKKEHNRIVISRENKGESQDGENELGSPSYAYRIKKDLLSILKVMTIVSIAEDEVSTEFLSTYENYRKINEKLNNYGLENSKSSEEGFSMNPIQCWMHVIVTTMVALYAFSKDGKDFICDVIGENDNNKGETKEIAFCFSTVVNLESFDWKEHGVKLFLPSKGGMNILFIVDDDIRLFCSYDGDYGRNSSK